MKKQKMRYKIKNESLYKNNIMTENFSRNKSSSNIKKLDNINITNKRNFFTRQKNTIFFSCNINTSSFSFIKSNKKKNFLEQKPACKIKKDFDYNFDYNTNNLNQIYTQKNNNSNKSCISLFKRNQNQNIYINNNIINNKILINIKNSPNYTSFGRSPKNSVDNIKMPSPHRKMVKTNSFAVSKSHINNFALLNLFSKSIFNAKKRTNFCIYPNKKSKLNYELTNYFSPNCQKKNKNLLNINNISAVEESRFTYDRKIINSSFTRKTKSRFNISHNYEKSENNLRNTKQKKLIATKTCRKSFDNFGDINIISDNINRQIYNRNILNKMYNVQKKVKDIIYLNKQYQLKCDSLTNRNLICKNSPSNYQKNINMNINNKKNIINISKKNEINKKKFIFQKSQFLDFKKNKKIINININKSISRKKLISDLPLNTKEINNNIKLSCNKKIFEDFEEVKQNIKKEKRNNSFDNKKSIYKKTNTEDKNVKKKIMSKISCISKDGEIIFGEKKINQDRFFNSDLINDFKFIGVCDGHGENGHYVSEYIKINLPFTLNNQINHLISYQKIKKNIQEKISYIKKNNSDKNLKKIEKIPEHEIFAELLTFPQIKEILTKSFLYTNSFLLQKYEKSNDLQYSGSTCISLLFNTKNLNKIYISNLGDSRAIIIKEKNKYWTCKQLSRDHKPTEKDEAMRIYEKGGHIEKFEDEEGNLSGPLRVWDETKEGPGLAMTRSFGDIVGSNIGIINVPEVTMYDVKKEDKAIIVASDGLWEHVTNKEVVEVVKKLFGKKDTEIVVKELYNLAYAKWKEKEQGIDDTTIICAFLKNFGKKER